MAKPPPRSESKLQAQLTREGLTSTRWSNGPHAVYGTHEHPYGKVLVVATGSITFTVAGRGALTLHAGDRLELPPRTPHSAVVGPEGVVCLETHVERGGAWMGRGDVRR